ncbi:MAG: translation initiation factor IF-2 [Dehalococcoidia bacterium]|nr:translation initiation factor IF-2 [Dehalococcoidia bacterium]
MARPHAGGRRRSTRPQRSQQRTAPQGNVTVAQAGASGATQTAAPAAAGPARAVRLPRTLTVQQLASLLNMSGVDVIKQLMRNGVMASVNQVLDFDAAAVVATDLGFEVQEQPAPAEAVGTTAEEKEDPALLKPRPPVVTILGHVDHGKTTLLDAIRKTNVAAREAGSITQHIGAYQVEVDGKKITFLDTPGHEAFTAMRARGAQVTDIAVLVVAADDGVMPQTVEAMDHAKAAGVPIIVAVNKIDKPEANPDRVKKELADRGLVAEDWGGDAIFVPVSAKQQKGIKELLESILLVAEVQELKANPDRPASGIVVEAELDSNKGPVATVLIRRGTLKVGDAVIVGDTWGKIKAMLNDQGRRVKTAGPATPVEILGLNAVPQAGNLMIVMPEEKAAKALAEQRQQARQAEARGPAKATTLEEVFAQIEAGAIKELSIVLKADVQGSLEPIRTSLERLSSDKAKVKIIHAGVGNITQSDILLAIASRGFVIGFSVHPEPEAKLMAETEGVDIRQYNVIYTLVEDVQKALTGLLQPTIVEVKEGRAEVKAVFGLGKKGKVAGCLIQEGKVSRGSLARLFRGKTKVHEGSVAGLKRFKEDVREVMAGLECGVNLDKFNDYQVGDVLEFFRKERSGQAA